MTGEATSEVPQMTDLIDFLLRSPRPKPISPLHRGVGFLTLAACALVIGLALSHAAAASSAAPADIAAAAPRKKKMANVGRAVTGSANDRMAAQQTMKGELEGWILKQMS